MNNNYKQLIKQRDIQERYTFPNIFEELREARIKISSSEMEASLACETSSTYKSNKKKM
jgi:hypothetical protein